MVITTREIYDRFAAAADLHDATTPPAQFNRWATQENFALALFLARSGWTQNVTTQTITVVGTESGAFPLTTAPLAIAAVHQVKGRVCRQIHLNNAVDFLRQLPGTPITSGDPTEYRVLWDQANDRLTLNFYPSPTTGSVIVVSYIPEPARLTLDASPAVGFANTVSYPMGWEERIILGCARRQISREEGDVSDILRQIAETDRFIEEACFDRVIAEHPTIRNLDSKTRGWNSDMFLPAPAAYWWR